MKPNIYRFADVVDGTDVYEKIKDAIINNRMIPVLGSGFSYGFKANNGTVPSVNDLKEKIDSPVIRSLTPGVLFTCLSKNLKSTMLIGIPANEVICMSVEHLPTWVSLLTVCLTEQSFKKTGLGKIVERQFNRDKNAKTSLVTAVNAAVNTFA